MAVFRPFLAIFCQLHEYLSQKNFAAIWQKDILTLDGLEKEQLIQLDDVTRIKLALRNQGQLAPFVCLSKNNEKNNKT